MDTFDILYKGLSEEDREKLSADVEAILSKSIEQSKGLLEKEVAKAVEKLNSKLIVNPWVQWVEENGSSYAFISALREDIWKSMMKTSPTKAWSYPMKDLIKAWRENFPGEFEEILGKEIANEIQKLQEDLARERRWATNRY